MYGLFCRSRVRCQFPDWRKLGFLNNATFFLNHHSKSRELVTTFFQRWIVHDWWFTYRCKVERIRGLGIICADMVISFADSNICMNRFLFTSSSVSDVGTFRTSEDIDNSSNFGIWDPGRRRWCGLQYSTSLSHSAADGCWRYKPACESKFPTADLSRFRPYTMIRTE